MPTIGSSMDASSSSRRGNISEKSPPGNLVLDFGNDSFEINNIFQSLDSQHACDEQNSMAPANFLKPTTFPLKRCSKANRSSKAAKICHSTKAPELNKHNIKDNNLNLIQRLSVLNDEDFNDLEFPMPNSKLISNETTRNNDRVFCTEPVTLNSNSAILDLFTFCSETNDEIVDSHILPNTNGVGAPKLSNVEQVADRDCSKSSEVLDSSHDIPSIGNISTTDCKSFSSKYLESSEDNQPKVSECLDSCASTKDTHNSILPQTFSGHQLSFVSEKAIPALECHSSEPCLQETSEILQNDGVFYVANENLQEASDFNKEKIRSRKCFTSEMQNHIAASVSVKPKFPGPAGLLPNLNTVDGLKYSEASKILSAWLDDSCKPVQEKSSYEPPPSVSLGPLWTSMLTDLDLDPNCPESPLNRCNIRRSVTQQVKSSRGGGSGRLRRVPLLAVQVNCITPAHNQATLLLSDHTGEVSGLLSSSGVAEYLREVCVGCVILLSGVTVWHRCHGRPPLLTITAHNISAIYAPTSKLASAASSSQHKSQDSFNVKVTSCLTLEERRRLKDDIAFDCILERSLVEEHCYIANSEKLDNSVYGAGHNRAVAEANHNSQNRNEPHANFRAHIPSNITGFKTPIPVRHPKPSVNSFSSLRSSTPLVVQKSPLSNAVVHPYKFPSPILNPSRCSNTLSIGSSDTRHQFSHTVGSSSSQIHPRCPGTSNNSYLSTPRPTFKVTVSAPRRFSFKSGSHTDSSSVHVNERNDKLNKGNCSVTNLNACSVLNNQSNNHIFQNSSVGSDTVSAPTERELREIQQLMAEFNDEDFGDF